MSTAQHDTPTADADGGSQVPLRRNEIVQLLGVPSETLGNVNEPRLMSEHGIEFNEKWVYTRPKRDPSRPRARVIYWSRYGFVAAARVEQSGQWVRESAAELRARHRELPLRLPRG
jgi:hypothetical protein